METSAIIVNYKTGSLTKELIQNLTDQSLIAEIIVVDNSLELKNEKIPLENSSIKYVYIPNQKNRGFASGANKGIKAASKDWILLVNPDVRLEENCLERLVKSAIKYKSNLTGPRFYWDEDYLFRMPPAMGYSQWFEIAHKCAHKSWLDAELLSFYWQIRHERFWSAIIPFTEPFLSGACLLANRENIENQEGKLFDERYFLYFEDTDLCIQTMLKNGLMLCVPDAKAIHYYDQSPDPENLKKSLLMEESLEIFRNKYFDIELISKVKDNSVKSEKSEYEDLGEINGSPTFCCSEGLFDIPNETIYFEISVNPFFVPFIQKTIDLTDSVCISEKIWKRVSAGVYFCRIRGSISGVFKIWRIAKR